MVSTREPSAAGDGACRSLRVARGLAGVCAAERTLPRTTRPFQNLWIPPVIHGTSFGLTVGKSSQSFWPGATTATYSFNQTGFLGADPGPEQGRHGPDERQERPGRADHRALARSAPPGGDGRRPAPGHPGRRDVDTLVHRQEQRRHLLVPPPCPRDHSEADSPWVPAALSSSRIPWRPLEPPRTYGVDDLPLVLTSRRFHPNDQFSFEFGDSDKYGDFLLTNGTLDAQVGLPAQLGATASSESRTSNAVMTSASVTTEPFM